MFQCCIHFFLTIFKLEHPVAITNSSNVKVNNSFCTFQMLARSLFAVVLIESPFSFASFTFRMAKSSENAASNDVVVENKGFAAKIKGAFRRKKSEHLAMNGKVAPKSDSSGVRIYIIFFKKKKCKIETQLKYIYFTIQFLQDYSSCKGEKFFFYFLH